MSGVRPRTPRYPYATPTVVHSDFWFYVIMGSIFGGALLAGVALAWYAVATEPERRAAWMAECQRHDLTLDQCKFIYRVDSERRGDEAANAAMNAANTALWITQMNRR
jgi:hypothetical protein